ncbi:MAG TPA: hypothetical protein P5248_03990, partial [Bacteroidales bacterium]|nr:hypothetical protein [Bacteroidales bacterium]
MARLSGIVLSLCAFLFPFLPAYAQGRDYALEAFSLRMEGQWTLAEQLLEHAIAVDSADARAYFELGRIRQLRLTDGLDRFGQVFSELTPRIKAERALLEECIRRDPAYARAHLWAGINESQLLMAYLYTPSKWVRVARISKRSIAYFQNAVALDPGMMEARAHLVSMQRFGWFFGGDRRAAWEGLRYLAEKSPGFAVYVGADMMEEDQLKPFLDSLIHAHPDDLDLLEQAALYRHGWSKAERMKAWQRVLDRDPTRIRALNSMINSADSLSGDSLYVAYIQRLAAAHRSAPALLRSMEPKMYARLYRRLGDAEKAREYTKQARALDEAMIQFNL